MPDDVPNDLRSHKLCGQSDPQEKELEEILVRLDDAWGQLFRRVAIDLKDCDHAIPLMQMGLLRLLDGLGAQRMSDIAARLDLTQSGCTALVDRAIQSELVTRHRDPADRRVVWVQLTAQGNQRLDELRRLRSRMIARYLRHLDQGELSLLATLLGRVAETIAVAPSPDASSSHSPESNVSL